MPNYKTHSIHGLNVIHSLDTQVNIDEDYLMLLVLRLYSVAISIIQQKRRYLYLHFFTKPKLLNSMISIILKL